MSTPTPLTPPQAKIQPQALEIHGDRRLDNYFWLNNADNPEVLAYLQAENDYADALTEHLGDLRETLYQELVGRIQETDLSVPYRQGDYLYYTRTESGKPYRIYCRKHQTLEAPEEILIDCNQLAAGREFFSLGCCEVSPDGRYLAYTTDTTGDERYQLYFRNLTTQETANATLSNLDPTVVWGNDSRTVFYLQLDRSYRPERLYRYSLGDPTTAAVELFHEADPAYYLSLDKTRSQQYVLLECNSKITSEVWFLNADTPSGEFQVVRPRQTGVEYSVEHHGEYFYIHTNEDAINFKLVQAPVTQPQAWETVLPHQDDVMLADIQAFARHLVLAERANGFPRLRVMSLDSGQMRQIDFPETAYDVRPVHNREFHAPNLRLRYTSLVTPPSIFDWNFQTGELQLLKETPVLGGYDRSQYEARSLYATAEDGTEIPISLVCKKDFPRDGSQPLWLTGYGSYGFPYPISFSSNRLSLLDRGFAFAIAHIRGGGERGRPWYEAGKLLHKRNTFTDFIACADYLVGEGWTSRQKLAISGGSAGGLLMGAVLNQRPDLCCVAVADVPFVDVVTTILDPKLPLSAIEWDEWGNPQQEQFYRYMLSYSPYDNVKPQDYPHILVLAGLHDARVKYWEPAKWTAKLRAMKTDNHRLVLKTNMEAGHGGASGRYGYLREIAFEYAFVLDCLGIAA